MSKLTKRLLCIAVMILMIVTLGIFGFAEEAEEGQEPVCYEHGDVNTDGSVDTRDAIHVLYHIMLGNIPAYKDQFAIDQDWDYDPDGKNDTADAIYLLYHIMLKDSPYGEQFELQGVIHDYYDPTWTWDETAKTAEVTFKCGCGTPSTYTVDTGVTVTAGTVVEATCVEAGSETYVASVTVDGKAYTNTYVKTLPAGTGHKMAGTQDCLNGDKCLLCDYALPALGHKWVLESATEATCTADAYQTYKCSACDATDTVTQEGTAGHTLRYDKDVQDGCKFTKWYACTECDYTAAGTAASDTYYNHTYTAELTKEATCVSKGEKTYKCSCGVSYTEEIAVNDSHAWVQGETVDGVTTHTCSNAGCTATKTTVTATKDTELKTEDLTNELQLENGASMALDEKTVEALDDSKTVVVSITPLEEGDALLDKLTDAQKEQIGTNTVYDFNMNYSDGSSISEDGTQFAGEVTISLPYTLEPGEDIDSIDVWYIDDDGNATQVKGTYSNGFVTFTTTHFSYYTVTRLTPAERCGRYGHIMVESYKAATCTTDGYDMSICQRCGHAAKDEVLTRSGHSYTENVTAKATCETAGSFEKVCQTCQDKVTGTIPAIGHDLQKDDAQTVEASCKTAGKEVYVCANGCGHTREDAQAQLTHNYQPDEEKAADCTTKGYVKNKCTLCGDVVTVSEEAPLGHAYEVSGWQWSDDHYTATVTLVCAHNAKHTKDLTAVVTEKKANATCMGAGAVTFTATASFNQVTYTDSYTQSVAAVGHKPGTEWASNATQHYHVCTVCEEKVDATAHTWDEGTVIQAATCGEPGSAVYKCTVCGYEKEKVVPATKEHTYVNGVCSVCGHEENSCIHLKTTATELDLTGYGLCAGAEITKYSCDCGENTRYNWDLNCAFGKETQEKVTVNGQECVKMTAACEDCGLVFSYVILERKVEDACAEEHVVEITFTKDGQQIVTFAQVEGVIEHPAENTVEVDLTAEAYGLCSEILVTGTCGCDQQVVRTESVESCLWIHVNYNGETGISVYECESCGAQKNTKANYVEDPDNCQAVESYTVEYFVDGVSVYTYTNTYTYDRHDVEVTDHELLGTLCTDGVLVEVTCAVCGMVDEDYIEWHENIFKEVTDLSGYAICADSMVTWKCACELAFQTYVLSSGDDTYCQWQETAYNKATNTTTFTCSVCGAIRNQVNIVGEKQEGCVVYQQTVDTYTQADGTQIAVGIDSWETEEHNYETTYELKGKTCEDGVKITNTCADCGLTDSYTTTGHNSFKKQTYDLAAYDMCYDAVTVYGCACGYNNYISWEGGSGCNWMMIGGAMYSELYLCETCNTIYESGYQYEATDDPCLRKQIRTTTLSKNDEANTQLLQFSYERYSENHDLRASFVLNDSTAGCEGGYTVTETCQNCGWMSTMQESGNSEHWTYLVDKQVISEGQVCGTVVQYITRCACGENESTHVEWEGSECTWDWSNEQWSEELGGWVVPCSTCGVSKAESNHREKVEGTTCQYKIGWHYSFTKDGEELFFYDEYGYSYQHDNLATFTLEAGATDCTGGWIVSMVCQLCGNTESWGGYDHFTEIVAKQTVTQMCGAPVLQTNRCACGYYDDTYLSWQNGESCSWGGNNWSEEAGAWVTTCSTCGTTRYHTESQESVEGSCRFNLKTDYTFVKDGQEILAYTQNSYGYDHEWIYTFQMNGSTCQEGYYPNSTCQNCGETRSYGLMTDCNTYAVEIRTILDSQDICGKVQLTHYQCACGTESRWQYNYDCSFQEQEYSQEEGGWIYICSDCGLKRIYAETHERMPGTCQVNVSIRCSYVLGEETYNADVSYTSKEHELVFSFQLNGDSCEDGYYVSYKCAYCDYSGSYEELRYFHDNHQTAYYDLADYGLCGGELRNYSCACGNNSHWEYPLDCNWTETGKTDADTGLTERYCADCGTYLYWGESGERNAETCLYEGTFTFKAVRDGENKLDVTGDSSYGSHNYEILSVTLRDQAAGCNGGVDITGQCQNCGDTYTNTSYYHYTYLKETIDLKELGACGGYIYVNGCACGQEDHTNRNMECNSFQVESWQQIDENGIEHYYTENVCGSCGLTLLDEWYEIKEANSCDGIHYEIGTVSIGDYSTTTERSWEIEDHSFGQETYTLKEGSVTCEDGITGTNTCQVCGYVSTWNSYSHDKSKAGSIDLSAYGSVCGATLDLYSCPCGAEQRYELGGEPGCDAYGSNIDHWIEGVIDEYQENTHQESTYSYSYLYKCAVTDPDQCGLAIRMSEYWLKDGCSAVQYQTWQLGYDEETNTWQKEITIATGKAHGYHNYVYEDLEDAKSDGSIQGYKYTCSDCGSYYLERNVYDENGNRLQRETECVNTLDNGEYKRRYYLEESAIQSNGLLYTTRLYRANTYADGTEYWSETTYTFDFTNGCNGTWTTTDSNGVGNNGPYEPHQEQYHSEYLMQGSCSQHSVWHYWYECQACGQITGDRTEEYEPYDHNWSYDSVLQTYVCGRCGLENSNGASGSIVMEELTETYGEGSHYVIGYWNRGNVEFIPNVSVILDNATGDDNQIDLGITDFAYHTAQNDGFTGLSFDKAVADAAAAEAVAAIGYTGTYAIRISFVPVNSTDTLDYAITFDSVTAE